MKLFDFLFSADNSDPDDPDIKFGRYSDAYKESDQYDLWDESLNAFDQKKYRKSYRLFLQYLNDPDID
ncbi:MAG: hypothetical protein KJP00_09100, partial [Bacteroidia bacterium]|nr:hypothetical protein [Bacteroidia bacterium]